MTEPLELDRRPSGVNIRTAAHVVTTFAVLTGLLAACATGDGDPGPDLAHAAPSPAGPSTDSTTEQMPPYEVTDYTYTLRRNCFCADGGVPVAVTVRDGEVVDAVYLHKRYGHAAGAPAARWNRVSINDVIDAVTRARARGAYLVKVRWPDGQDYPRSVWIDQDGNAVDEEIGYTISNVSPD